MVIALTFCYKHFVYKSHREYTTSRGITVVGNKGLSGGQIYRPGRGADIQAWTGADIQVWAGADIQAWTGADIQARGGGRPNLMRLW